jgi:Flp pilus assembly pilin Flp
MRMSQLPGVEPLEKPPNMGLTRGAIADRRATVAVEYAILGGLMALIAISSFTFFGDSASGLWSWLGGELGDAMGP